MAAPSMTITDRMHKARVALGAHWSGRRYAKAFYLGPDDWAEFMATDPPTVRARWGNDFRDEPSFEEVPVRPSLNVAPRQSRLYDNTGTGREL